jgi:hypothetical protein
MTDILKPGVGFLFMKVGTHAGEELDDIIARKQREIADAGYALWGYGGNTCHPFNTVQPYARDYVERNGVIYLVMQPMVSRHAAPPMRASEFSRDGVTWEPVPAGINVLGSRYALAIGDLERDEFDLALAKTKVAAGMSAGRRGDKYISGRVDKGILEVSDGSTAAAEDEATVHIGLVARMVEPYAVLVR